MVNSISCPPNSKAELQANPPSSGLTSADLNMASIASGMTGLAGGSPGSPHQLESEDCKQAAPSVKLEMLEEIFGSGWEDHGLSGAGGPLLSHAVSPPAIASSPASNHGLDIPSLAFNLAPRQPNRPLKLEDSPGSYANDSDPNTVFSSLSPLPAISLASPLSSIQIKNSTTSLLSLSASSKATQQLLSPTRVTAGPTLATSGLQVIIPPSPLHPDTTTLSISSPVTAAPPSISANSSPPSTDQLLSPNDASTPSSNKKTIFTAKGKGKTFPPSHLHPICFDRKKKLHSFRNKNNSQWGWKMSAIS